MYPKLDDFLSYLLNLETISLSLVWIRSSTWGSLRYADNFAMVAMDSSQSNKWTMFWEIQGTELVKLVVWIITIVTMIMNKTWILKGALVGVPNQKDEWTSDRTNYAVKKIPSNFLFKSWQIRFYFRPMRVPYCYCWA